MPRQCPVSLIVDPKADGLLFTKVRHSTVAKPATYATFESQQFRDGSTGPKVRGQFKRYEPQDLEGGFCYLAADGHK